MTEKDDGQTRFPSRSQVVLHIVEVGVPRRHVATRATASTEPVMVVGPGCDAGGGKRASHMFVATFSGHCRFRSNPSRISTVGRIAVKSKNSSGSMSAKRSADHRSIRCRTVVDAASPASFQPSNAQIKTGARSVGSAVCRTWFAVWSGVVTIENGIGDASG